MGAVGVRRDVGVDVVRALALVAMYAAHTSSRGDPGLRVLVVNLVTAALFAVLVGVGGGLAALRPGGGLRAAVVAPLVRGAALVVLGFVLIPAGSSVIVILVHLGLLTVAVGVLARCPTWLVLLVGGGLLAASPVLKTALAPLDARASTDGPHWLALAVDLTATGETYRLTALLGWAALGIVLARAVPADGGGVRVLVEGTAALAAAAVVGIVGGRPVPYSGTHLEITLAALLAAGVLLTGIALARLAGPALGWLAAPGRMTLTLYTVHVLALAWLETGLRPGVPPYGADVLAALLLGSAVVALLWNLLPAGRSWGRGPLEGLVERAVRLLEGTRSTPAGGAVRVPVPPRVTAEHRPRPEGPR